MTQIKSSKNHRYCPNYRPWIKREHQCHQIDLIFNSFSEIEWIIIRNWTISTIKTKNFWFWCRNGRKWINSQKILEMNRQGNNIIVFNSIQIKNKLKFSNWIAFLKKKIWQPIEVVNSMYGMTMNRRRLVQGVALTHKLNRSNIVF